MAIRRRWIRTMGLVAACGALVVAAGCGTADDTAGTAEAAEPGSGIQTSSAVDSVSNLVTDAATDITTDMTTGMTQPSSAPETEALTRSANDEVSAGPEGTIPVTSVPGTEHGTIPAEVPGGSSAPTAESLCSQTTPWTTADEAVQLIGPNAPISTVVGATTNCYDEIDISIGPSASAPNYDVRYVPQVTAQGSGAPLSLAGSDYLRVIIVSPVYDTTSGQAIYVPNDPAQVVDVSGFPVVQQVAYGGSFEGQTTFGIGVSGQQPFTVESTTDSNNEGHLVVKIAH